MQIVVNEMPRKASECLFCRDTAETYWIGNEPIHNPIYECQLDGLWCCNPETGEPCKHLITFNDIMNKTTEVPNE